jgi:hypothetical protein
MWYVEVVTRCPYSWGLFREYPFVMRSQCLRNVDVVRVERKCSGEDSVWRWMDFFFAKL